VGPGDGKRCSEAARCALILQTVVAGVQLCGFKGAGFFGGSFAIAPERVIVPEMGQGKYFRNESRVKAYGLLSGKERKLLAVG
jgi:hypothetical protein